MHLLEEVREDRHAVRLGHQHGAGRGTRLLVDDKEPRSNLPYISFCTLFTALSSPTRTFFGRVAATPLTGRSATPLSDRGASPLSGRGATPLYM